MLAYSQACTAADIKVLNREKEYTLISTQLLQTIFTDTRLNDHAIKCWQVLFNKSRFSENLEITISYNRLANELGRSKRTIMRYIQQLTKYNYLEIRYNENQMEGKMPNTLFVRVPTLVVDKVKSSKDRTRKSITENTPNYVMSNKVLSKVDQISKKNVAAESTHEFSYMGESSLDSNRGSKKIHGMSNYNSKQKIECQIENGLQNKANLHILTTIERMSVSTHDYNTVHNQHSSSPSVSFASLSSTNTTRTENPIHTQETNSNSGGGGDGVLMSVLSSGASDNIDTQYNNIKDYNNKNSAVVVQFITNDTEAANVAASMACPSIKTLQTITQLEKTLLEIKEQERIGNKDLLSTKYDKQTSFHRLEQLGALTSKKEMLQLKLDTLRKKAEKENRVELKQKILSEKNDYFLKQPGANPINSFSFNRITKTLQNYGYSGMKLNILINEIIFEVRFGSLLFCNQTKERLHTNHAISIALKLVRDGRWTTPVLMKKI